VIRRAALWGAMLLVLAWSLGPFLWQGLTSLKPTGELSRLPPILPTAPTLDHYRGVFEGRPFARYLLNSAAVAGGTTLLALAVGSLAAFALARLPVPGRRLILGLFLSITMFPPIATVSPLYLGVRALGLRDTLFALIVVDTTFALPLAVWVLTGFFREIPEDLHRAARVDGCTPFQAFRRVHLPLAAPGLFATGILVFIAAWNELLFALTFTATDRSRTVPVALALFPGLHEVPWGEIAAASVIVTIPLVVLVLLFQRRIVSGLLSGAVK